MTKYKKNLTGKWTLISKWFNVELSRTKIHGAYLTKSHTHHVMNRITQRHPLNKWKSIMTQILMTIQVMVKFQIKTLIQRFRVIQNLRVMMNKRKIRNKTNLNKLIQNEKDRRRCRLPIIFKQIWNSTKSSNRITTQ